MSKKLTAYFSATGVTRRAAMALADFLGTDIYEIKPRVPYTDADLNWRDKKSRSSVEMADRAFRPPIEEGDINISAYDVIYLGFPIWWYVAPTIINTFLERYDFSGKTVILFATSGGSGFGETAARLRDSVPPSAVIKEGKVLGGSLTKESFTWAL